MISQSPPPTEPIRCPIPLMHYCPRLQAVVILLQLLLEWTMLLEQSSMVQPVKEEMLVKRILRREKILLTLLTLSRFDFGCSSIRLLRRATRLFSFCGNVGS